MAVMVQRKTPPLGRRKGPNRRPYRAVPAMSGHCSPRRWDSVPVVVQSGDDAVTAVARTYRRFGRLEARGRSAAYEALAESVAGDAALVSFIASLPPEKRQPNLLFAAARYLLGAPPEIGSLRELASQSRAGLTEVILTRRTQTNEPARCAVLLPALA